MKDASVDFEIMRERFPVFECKAYMDSCSYGALATDVSAAFERYMQDRLEYGSNWGHWIERNEAVRASVAKLLGAEADEIAINGTSSSGINSLASALDFSGPRNRVVITDLEFPTNAQIWYAQEARGAEIVRVRARDGRIDMADLAAAVDERTKIVATTFVCYRNGRKQDIPAITKLAHDAGALMFVDAYQAIGTQDFDVHAAGVDALSGGNLKYLLGTAGLAFLYVKKELVSQLNPTVTGWFAQEDITAMDHTGHHPSPTARRFEMGTPAIPNCYASEAGLAIIHEVGLPAIEAHIKAQVATLKDAVRDAGFQLHSPENPEEHGAMTLIRSTDGPALVERLAAEDIVGSTRDGHLRISMHFYNNNNDIMRLVEALHKNKDLMV